MIRRVAVVVSVFCLIVFSDAYKKPFCELCENIVKKVDDVLKEGGDIEKAVDEFCRNDVAEFLVEYCEKIIAKNLKYIIEKLKDHESPEKICFDIYFCTTS
ncbi:Saposin-like type B, region 1 [Dictyocaulus viviparus]|uniref:Saposin-like type B, region 1 n=1 Tax=Dictyocaulus viviparus TaxID=29172 RepID=A0A0D8Y913_DICVI|nr:Saposin-like type B, region 1 [Dictyocaulus viviparus]